jgi:hypothetical protein
MKTEQQLLAEELTVVDGDSPLWQAVRPLLDVALRLEQLDGAYSWHGWSKRQIDTFLANLPPQCSLVVGVWETEAGTAGEREFLVLGFVCEVVGGEVCSVRTFESLAAAGLKAVKHLEPGFEDAFEIMRVARTQVAPVAWGLFTDRTTWDEWLFASNGDVGEVIDKGELLASFACKGRCVLLSSEKRSY